MAHGWTPARRARQARAIKRWRPWDQSTGPRTAAGKARSARNAFRGGTWRTLRVLSKMVNADLRAQRTELRELTHALSEDTQLADTLRRAPLASRPPSRSRRSS